MASAKRYSLKQIVAKVLPKCDQVLPIRVADPAGGPAWGRCSTNPHAPEVGGSVR